MNKLFTKVATLCVGLAMAAGVGVAVGSAEASEAKAATSFESVYVLDGTQVQEDNDNKDAQSYSASKPVTQSNVTWEVYGNTTINPWRLGGKNFTGTDRVVRSKSAVSSENVAKVELTVGTATITVNSLKLLVGSAEGGSQASTVTASFVAASKIVFERPSNADWTGKYFTFDFNLTNTSTSSNKYVQFTKAEFFKESSKEATSVTITNESPIVLHVGNNQTSIGVTTSPANLPLTYSSSNADVLTVDVNGLLTPVSNGVAVITVSYAGDDTHVASSDSIDVTVLKAASVLPAVGSISITKDDLDKIGAGSSYIDYNGYHYASVANSEAEIIWHSTQAMVGTGDNSSKIQLQKDTSEVHNYTPLPHLKSVTLTETTGDYTLKYGETIDNITLESLTDDCKFFSIKGNATVLISSIDIEYGEEAPTLESIAVSGTYKTTYEIGEEFNPAGIVVTATYSDQSQQVVTTGIEYSGFSSQTAGQKTITVTYEGKSTTFNVTVNEPAPVTYSVTYKAGDGQGTDHVVSNIEAGSKHALITFAQSEFVAPEGKQFKAWSVDSAEQQPGYEVTVNSNIEVVAIYEDAVAPVTDWSADQKTAFAAELDEFVPPYVAAFGAEDAMTIYDGQNMAYGFVEENVVSDITAAFVAAQYGQPSEKEGVYSYSVPTTNGSVSVEYGYSDTQTVGTYWIIMYTAAATSDWSDAQKEAMTTNVGLVLPYLGDDIAAAFTLNDSDPEDVYFEGEVDGNQILSIYQAFGSAQWDYFWMNEANYNYFFTNPCSTGTAVFQCGAYQDSNQQIHTFFYYYFSFYRGIIETHASVEAYVGDSVSDLELELALVNTEMQGSLIKAENCEFSVDKFEEAGEVTVYVYYNYFYGSFKVNVKAVEATGLTIDASNVKSSYEIGEEFDPTGLVATLQFNNGSTQDVSADVELSGFDSQTAGEKTITVAYGDFSKEFTVTVNAPAPVYDADAFAKELLEKVAPICANYDGKKSNKTALKEVWTEMAVKYGTLSEEEKAKVVAAAAKADGTDLEKAMAFYNFACKKYGLTKFIAGRQVKAIVNEPVQSNSILPIIVIVASSVAAVTAIGVVIALKRRKSLLTK